jgi:hypothetical protein
MIAVTLREFVKSYEHAKPQLLQKIGMTTYLL